MVRSGKVRWFGISVLVIVLIAAISLLALLFISSAKLRSQMAKSGKIRTIEEIIGPKIPDEVNSAPIYNLVFKELERPATYEATRPIEMFAISTPEEFRKDPIKAAELEAAVDKAVPLMTLMSRAAEKPKCQFTRNWSSPVMVMFPEFARMRSLARIASGTAVVRAHQGRMQDAVAAMDTGLKITNAAKSDPILIGHLVSIATLKIMTARLRLLPEHGHLTEAQAKTLYDTISGIDFMSSFTACTESERATGMWIFKEARKNPKATAAMLTGISTSGSRASEIAMWARAIAKKPFIGLDQAAYLKAMQRNIEASKYTYREAEAKGLWIKESDLPGYATVARMTVPTMSRASVARDSAISEADGSRIFLALLAYKDRYKTYPATLKELRDTLGWELPKDVFSGRDFVYKRKEDGFLLYGVGMNMKDDGGTPSKSGPDKGDIVWEMKK